MDIKGEGYIITEEKAAYTGIVYGIIRAKTKDAFQEATKNFLSHYPPQGYSSDVSNVIINKDKIWLAQTRRLASCE